MTAITPDRERRLLPRFRASAAAVTSGDLQGLSTKSSQVIPPAMTPDFDALKNVWRDAPSLETATELVCTAMVLGRQSEVHAAAEQLLREQHQLRPIIVNLATANLAQGNDRPEEKATATPSLLEDAQIRSDLATLKYRLAANPRNPIAWMDRAHLHTLLGQKTSASKAIQLAVALAPDNRFILRGASRFYVHDDEPDRGLHALRSSMALRSDPWLMAAEVALSTMLDTAPASFTRAKALLIKDDLNPWHTGELNGAMGTLAMHDRALGKPSQFFRRSLRNATENATAQAQWFANFNPNFDIPTASLNPHWSPEASALKARAEKNWPLVVRACRDWMMMDPTSTRPLYLAAFVTCTALHDGKAALPFTHHWIRIDPTSSMAWNNHTVALVYAGQLKAAKEAFTRVTRVDSENYPDAVYLATEGLLAYRSGDRELGQKLYLQAAETNRAKNDSGLRALVWWHLLREEARSGVSQLEPILNRTWEITKGLEIPELLAMKESVHTLYSQTVSKKRIVTFSSTPLLPPPGSDSWG